MLVSVQALRAIAAISVVLCHFDQTRMILVGRGNEAFPLYFLASGVDLFFVISGFIMVHSSERLFGAPGVPMIFLGRRLSRIVPLYWIVTFVSIWLTKASLPWEAISGSLFFIPYVSNVTTEQALPILGVGWTLNYELLFYVLFATALFLPRGLAISAVCATLFMMAIVGHYELIAHPTAIRFWCDPIVLEFGMGIAIAVAYRRSIKLPAPVRIFLIIAAIAIIYHFQGRVGGAGMPSGDRLLVWGVPTSMIFAAFVLGPFPNFYPPLRIAITALGDASYSVYLLHTLVTTCIAMGGRRVSQFGVTSVLIVGFVLTIVLSILTHRLIERPAMNGLRALSIALRAARSHAIRSPC